MWEQKSTFNVDTNIWDRSGMVVEVCPFRQYKVKMHGSGRVSTRNRIHLRPVLVFKPVTGTKGAVQRTQPPLPSALSVDTSTPLSHAATPEMLPSPTTTTTSHSESSSSSQTSSYQPSSVDDSSYQSVRSRSPLRNRRRPQRKNTSPDRYGTWQKH